MRRTSPGFTLIELLVVVAIVGILAVALLVVINPANSIKKSRDSKRISDIHAIKTALESYATLNQSPPNCDSTPPCPTNFKLSGTDPISQMLVNGNYIKQMLQPPPQPTTSVCDYQIYLYPGAQKEYNLRWCFESWDQSRVTNLVGNGTKYFCSWDAPNQVAVCFTGTNFEIPQL